MANVINVTACDNELIVLAYEGNSSYELCRICSGYKQPVSVNINITAGFYSGPIPLTSVYQPLSATINPQIPAGKYSLVLLGIDWGGPYAFAGNALGVAFNVSSPNGADGLVYHSNPIPFTV